MAFVAAKGVAVSIDGDDLSIYSNSVTFTRTADALDVTTFGKTSKVYISGLKDGTGSIEGIYDNTAGTGPGAVIRPLLGGDAVSLVWMPEGESTGKPAATVDVIVTSYEESAPVAEVIAWTVEFQMSDDIADSTQS